MVSHYPPVGLDGLAGGGGAVDVPLEAHLLGLSGDPAGDLELPAGQEVDPLAGPLTARSV